MKAICPVCGKEFTASVEGHAGHTKRYCSAACRRKHEKDRVKAAIKAAKAGRKCAWCGKDISNRNASAKFCSWHCKNAAGRYARKHAAAPAAQPTADQAYEASVARVRAYLKLPARARWANRGMLTDTELRMAEQMWKNHHDGWEVRFNTSMH